MNSITHEIKCPNCFNDLTQAESVEVHFSAGGHEFDKYSSVDKDGVLSDPTEEGLIAMGLHAGTRCQSCDEQLDEMIPDQWYVRAATGTIAGPMVKAVALEVAGEVDGMPFSAAIFEPQFVTTPEVEKLLADLVCLKSEWEPADTSEDLGEIPNLCQKAIDTIVLLSREKVVTGTIEGGVLELDSVPVGVTVDIKDRDCEGMDEETVEEDSTGSFFQAG